jgi:hypothetical protein
MGITTRMLPRDGTPQTGTIGSGQNTLRAYTATGGGFIDALGDPSCDASTLVSQGFFLVGGSGTTAQRPNGTGFLKAGFVYVDTTLGLVVVFDGMNYRNPVTGAIA